MSDEKDKTITQSEGMKEFLKVTFYLNDEELKALDKQIPMTPELFDRCCDKLSEIGAEKELLQFMLDYPEFLLYSAQKIERELELSDADYPKMTEEESKALYERIMAQVKKEKEKIQR